ncbi:MAG: ATP-binding protein [Bacteroidales bacterium]|nr:ATP-binding protein [Bacteroidales bacterium]
MSSTVYSREADFGNLLHFQQMVQLFHSPEAGFITLEQGFVTKPGCDKGFSDKCKILHYCGKSYLVSALGHQACLKGYKVLYFNCQKLFPSLKVAKADGSYPKETTRIEKSDLLILDDFGLQSLDAQTRMILLEIIEDRYDKKSTIIGSQLPVDKWYDIIGEGTIADAILDRLYHGSHRIDLKGESMRKKNNK